MTCVPLPILSIPATSDPHNQMTEPSLPSLHPSDSYLMSDCISLQCYSHEYNPQLAAHIELLFLWKASLLFKEEQYTLVLNAFILAAVEQIIAAQT